MPESDIGAVNTSFSPRWEMSCLMQAFASPLEENQFEPDGGMTTLFARMPDHVLPRYDSAVPVLCESAVSPSTMPPQSVPSAYARQRFLSCGAESGSDSTKSFSSSPTAMSSS